MRASARAYYVVRMSMRKVATTRRGLHRARCQEVTGCGGLVRVALRFPPVNVIVLVSAGAGSGDAARAPAVVTPAVAESAAAVPAAMALAATVPGATVPAFEEPPCRPARAARTFETSSWVSRGAAPPAPRPACTCSTAGRGWSEARRARIHRARGTLRTGLLPAGLYHNSTRPPGRGLAPEVGRSYCSLAEGANRSSVVLCLRDRGQPHAPWAF